MSDIRTKVFNAIDEVADVQEWYAVRMHLVRKYLLELEDYIKQIEQDYDELSK